MKNLKSYEKPSVNLILKIPQCFQILFKSGRIVERLDVSFKVMKLF